MLDVPGWPGHRAGQHVDVRLTAEDGYQAQRSYSIASAPGGRARDHGRAARRRRGLAVPRRRGARRRPLELRGPIGGYFVWERPDGGPLLLVAGGSGVVPLMAMIRHRAAPAAARRRGCSTRRGRCEDVIYRDELDDSRPAASRSCTR